MRFALILTQLHFSCKNPLNEHELLLCESIALMSHDFQTFVDIFLHNQFRRDKRVAAELIIIALCNYNLLS